MNSDSKEYPTNYPADAIAILDSMSVTEGKGVELVGSMSLRSQQYAGDYDANDIVELKYASDKEALDHCAKDFCEAVRRTSKIANAYIGDIKCGEIAEWRVFGSDKDTRVHNGQVVGYNAETSRSKVRALRKAQIITPTEEKEALALLPSNPTPIQLVKAKDSIKFHIVRWSVAEVLEGEKRLKDGRTYTLQDGFSSHGITKVDVVAWVQNNRYTEFAMIYFLFNNGKALNPMKFDYEDSLKESILYYASEGMYFKVLKRQFSLAKFKDDKQQMEKLTEILNSDLGRLYHIVSDIRTLVFLLEEQSKLRMSDIKFEIDQFKGRMANIYALDPFLKKEFVFLGYISSALKSTSSKQLLGILKSMEGAMSSILGKASQKLVGGYRITRGAMEGMFPEGLSGIPSLVSNILTPSYHYLAQRPTFVERSASLGLRQLAEDLLDSYVKLDPTLTERNKEEIEKAKQGHSTAILKQEERIMNEKPTVKDFYNEELKEAYDKVLKVLDGDKKLAKFFFDYNPDIKTAKKGLESRAVEWALANREYWGTKAHPTLSKASTVSEAEGKETVASKRVSKAVTRAIPLLKGKVAETKARKEAEAKAKPAPAPTKAKPKAKKEKKAEEDEDELLRVATELAEAEKGKVAEEHQKELTRLFKLYAPADVFGLVQNNILSSADKPSEIRDGLALDLARHPPSQFKVVKGVLNRVFEVRPDIKKWKDENVKDEDLFEIYFDALNNLDTSKIRSGS